MTIFMKSLPSVRIEKSPNLEVFFGQEQFWLSEIRTTCDIYEATVREEAELA